jgi:hypothetical protein
MSDLTLKMLLFGEDKTASKAIKGVGDQAEKTSNHMAALGKGVGLGLAAAAGGIGLLLKTGFDETKDAATGTAQLEAGIKSTGNAAHVTVGGLNDLAGSIQSYSGQTDDSIVKSEQLLLTFTNIKNSGPDKIFDLATKATADMAAKMGGDASQSAIVLGKALNDPLKGITALQRIGVSFSDSQKKAIAAMMKTGDVAGAQKVILKELSTEFGGAAKAAGDSLPGQMQRAKRSFEDTSQAVVTDMLPVLNTLMKVVTNNILPAIKSMSQFWMDHKTLMTSVAGAILGVIVVVKAINLATKAWAAVQAALNVVMSLNPIALIIIAIVALIAIVVLIATKTRWFQNIWSVAFTAVKTVIMGLFNWVKSNWPMLLAILTGPIGVAVLLITRNWDTIKHGVTAVKDWIVGAFNTVLGVVTGLPGRIGRAASGMWDGVKNAFKSAINWIIGAWNGLQFSIHIPKIHIKGTNVDIGGGELGFGVPTIPMLALGGIAIGPTIAMIGERGPEAIVPLNRAKEYGFGGGSSIPVQVIVQMDGRTVASSLERVSHNGPPLRIRVAS